ncbi:hypothetical protein PTRG_11387 [Pyrenophora tritici-repentis Pt-1C-BFP]|uniref:Uncharacterized protein n=1 Tax=Pyrenophora tritici-repentis (strain Pt-1C-BFP) TaxID=426418 RepID=B2WND0_PYRTR|nr:uncharacterized protein PTRG_11387 [Pyrenophora tritici-repentis Pt-1C-BFP]EDU44437.1 hypothetical protein PTRG_11387 [Pyrenophora tritici-repentis Pt-1C-BFP]
MRCRRRAKRRRDRVTPKQPQLALANSLMHQSLGADRWPDTDISISYPEELTEQARSRLL